MTPVISIEAAGATAIDIDADGTGWVRVGGEGGPVDVSYLAGLAGGWSEVPAPIAQGVTMLAQHLAQTRDGAEAPPTAVAALWRPWRHIRLYPAVHA